MAAGGYRWLQGVVRGGTSVSSGHDDPPPPSPGHAGVRLLGPGHRGSQPHLQVRGPLRWGQVWTFFYTFYLDLLLGAKHKVLIFLYEDKMSCQSYHSRNLNIFGCGWSELLKVASCNILRGK